MNAKLLRVTLLLLALSQGACNLAVRFVTSPLDIKTRELSRQQFQRSLENEATGKEIEEPDRYEYTDAEVKNHVLRFRFDVQRRYKIEVRDRSEVFDSVRCEVVNPVADLLEVPATILDLPLLLLAALFSAGDNPPSFMPPIPSKEYFEIIGRGLLPGINTVTSIGYKEPVATELSIYYINACEPWKRSRNRPMEVTIDSKKRTIQTGEDGWLTLDLPRLDLDLEDDRPIPIEIQLDQVYRWTYNPVSKELWRK